MEAERSAAQAGVPPYGGRGDARTSPHGWGSGGGESPLFARSKEKTDNSNRKRKRETLQIIHEEEVGTGTAGTTSEDDAVAAVRCQKQVYG